MRPENKRMKAFLKANGIDCEVKYFPKGSMKNSWRLYNNDQKWTPGIWNKLNDLGFTWLDHQKLGPYHGNGGMFSVPVYGHYELLEEN
jgi:hypothetical protein